MPAAVAQSKGEPPKAGDPGLITNEEALEAARGHGSVENCNHFKRGDIAWWEDGLRHRKSNDALNLDLTRYVLLALIPFEEGGDLADFPEIYYRHPSQGIRLILKAQPVG